MRYIFCFIVFTCFYNAATGQKNKTRFDLEVFDAAKFRTLTVEIETKNKPALSTHFNTLLIRDLRADKSKLGFAKAGQPSEIRRLVFPEKQDDYLNKKLDRLYSGKPGTNDTILIALNNLWLFETRQQAGTVKRELLGELQLYSHCLVNYDIFLYKNGFTTSLGTADTVVSTKGWIVNKSNEVLKKALIASLTTCDSLFTVQEGGKTNGILANNVFTVPVKLADKYKMGIYFTYSDFVNNDPDTASFETEIKNGKRILKTSAYPDSVLAHCWGFCNKSGIYMNINNDFYRLNRSQNSFDLRAPLLVDIKNSTFSKIFRTGYSYFLIDSPFIDPSEFLKPGSQTLEFFKYYQLDMRTGLLR